MFPNSQLVGNIGIQISNHPRLLGKSQGSNSVRRLAVLPALQQ